MKILVVCQYYYPEEFRINDICETLAKGGNEVTCLTGLPNYETGKVLKEYKWFKKRKEVRNKVNIIRCFEIGRRKGILFRILNYISFMISASIKALTLKKDFDVVYVYQLSPVLMAIPGIIYKKIRKKKLVLYSLDLWPESITTLGINKNSIIYKIIDKISKKIYNAADVILVSSNSFINNFKRLKNNSKIIYLPQYTEEIYKTNEKTKNKKFIFTFAGNIGKAQTVETIIKAANILKEKQDIEINIVGDGYSLENCKNLAKEFDIKNVNFIGRLSKEEIQKYYSISDAMLVTLIKDEFTSNTLPGKIQTCMATKNIIIAAANGETKEIIEKADCGFCVEAENYEELAKAIIDFTNLTEEEKKIKRENSYKFYKDNFSKEKFIDNLQKILEKDDDKNV